MPRGSTPRSEIPRRRNRDWAPLSFAQHQFWLLDQLTPGNPAYNLPYGLRLRGPLDRVALEAGFNAIIERHEILRTAFVLKEGEPTQHIRRRLQFPVQFTALEHLQGPAREETLQRLAAAEAVRAFDLERPPLLRVSVFRLDEFDHVLLLNLHHIVADGLSVGRLLQELDAFYRGFTNDQPPLLPDLSVQYADFAAWQQKTLADETACADAIAFWQKTLQGPLPLCELPADKPRPAFQSFNGANVPLDLSSEQARALRSLGAREGCTFFMTVLAAFQVLLHRYSDLDDLVIGTPVGIRPARELEPLIGPFLNMIALRCNLSGHPTFVELLRRSRDTALEAFSHSELPFEMLVKHLKCDRDPSRNPIFQIALQVLPGSAHQLGDLDVSPFEFQWGSAQFDLTLHLHEEAGGYRGGFKYCIDLFDATTIQRLRGHFLTLLEAIAQNPHQAVSDLPLLTPAERHQVLVQWNGPQQSYGPARCVHELVEQQARLRPEALALQANQGQLTYGQLDRRAQILARHLRQLGVGANSLVAVCLPRSLELVVGLLAVWKAGAAYVPIDPEYPAQRIAFMLQDAGALALLTHSAVAQNLPATGIPLVRLDQPLPPPTRVEVEPGPDRSAAAEQLAYVIYTSGSTGRPKGVPIRHANLWNLIGWHQSAYQLSPADRATQIAGPGFDAAAWELWPCLAAGASVHIPDEATRLSESKLLAWLVGQAITVSFVPTPLAQGLLRLSWPERSCLRLLLTGGDRLTVRPPAGLPFRVVNHYGPTENTVVSTSAEVSPQPQASAPSIGRPLPNTQVYVLDRHRQAVPVGVPGELWLGGAQLTAGYWQRPELTAQSFMAHSLAGQPEQRLYRTGDRVRWLAAGSLEFLGRLDHQVKLRGFRIELGEIEAELRQAPGVQEAVVVVREERAGEPRLVAYLVAAPGPAQWVEQVRQRLRQRLPDYMVPSAYVRLDALPLSANGKLDRQGLPAPEPAAQASADYVPARTQT
ncbi:MAG: amino acid adenylation domain-containing protein, partial [Verrucomicrobia bacterium]|nr:amino acid adenylation domain-containing protein [Verrucomicrobiota bacterium]